MRPSSGAISLLPGGLLVLLFLAMSMDLNWIELAGCALAAVLAAARPHLGSAHMRGLARRFRRVAGRRGLCVVGIGALVISLRLALLPVAPIPEPVIVDEFSHLLLADTLAHGRLTNPTHPMWAHFETIHVIQKPTYNSMYFPGQALFLALGQTVFGHPWFGVLLSVGAMCAAICWMLQGWLPARWALLGALLAVVRFGLFGYWINSYWGGAPGALGGALVLGAWPRIVKSARFRSAAPLAAGLILLAISRPFEGLMLCLPAGFYLFQWFLRLGGSLRTAALTRVALPVMVSLLAAACMLGYYQWRVTGNPLRAPYTVNRQTYGWPMTLPWFPVRNISHSDPVLADYYNFEMREHAKLTSPFENWLGNSSDVVSLWSFFAGVVFTVPLLWLGRALKDGRVAPLAVVTAVVIGAVALEQSRYPHYLSPAAAAILVLLVQCLRHMCASARRRPALAAMVRLMPVVLLVSLAVRASPPGQRASTTAPGRYFSWCWPAPDSPERGAARRRFRETPGRHLVIVRYGPTPNFMNEMVYNEAGIDDANVVWARDLGEAANERLVAYFQGRRVWLLDASAAPARIREYRPETMRP